jgi:glucosamine--fructose-6-phosphate aminotransferase (isomerizing)
MFTDDYIDHIKNLAKKIKNVEHIYVIGRGFNYPIALEAALKIKEVSYIHAEGFASGELKHGVIALIEKGTPCIAIVANDEFKQDVITGATEIKSRGGYIIGISPESNGIFDYWIPVPDVGNASAIVNVIPAQLLAYYLAIERDCDPDYCRNLAKCVSVK